MDELEDYSGSKQWVDVCKGWREEAQQGADGEQP